jgi:hypothetical protein
MADNPVDSLGALRALHGEKEVPDDALFDVEPTAPEDVLTALSKKVKEAFETQVAIDELTASLAAANRVMQELLTKSIPDLMMQIGSSTFDYTPDPANPNRRVKCDLKEFVSGSLPKVDEFGNSEKRDKAIEWLEAHEGGDLIKTEVSLAFAKAERERAVALAAELRAKGYEPLVEEGVHSQTLCAFARERMRNGDELDIDVLGLYVGKVANIKLIDKPLKVGKK